MGSWYLIRHGETEWNRNGKIHGHSDISLSEHGRWQVKMLAQRLASEKLSCGYTSDLSRAMETAQAIAEDRGMAVEADAALREFCYGAWEGLTLGEVEAQYSSSFAERIALAEHAFSAPGGETTAHLINRVRRFYTKIVRRHGAGDNLVIVAHAGSIRAFLVCLLGLTDDHFWRFQVDCAGLSIIKKHPSGSVLELWNDTGHLISPA